VTTTDGWGIDDGWQGVDGRWHDAPAASIAAIGTAMQRDDSPTPPGRPVWVVRPDAAEPLLRRGELELEDGTVLGVLDTLPPDLPLGLHTLTPLDGGPAVTVIASPGRCHPAPDERIWGAAMQVATTRRADGWGIGDLTSVQRVASWLRGLGAGALALSPLHAPTPISPIEPSPYYPSSRHWRSPLLIHVDEVPGAADLPAVAELAQEARTVGADPIVDRDRVWALQRRALRAIWAARSGRLEDDLARWRADQGAALEGWARFCALADVHGSRWSGWPTPLRHPEGAAVAAEVERLSDEVGFHAWLQLLVERQLQAARVDGLRLIQDLAIGVDPGGADAWHLQDLLALDVSIGAPPDDFSPDGQGWGLPPFIPWRLRDAGYRPFAELLRSSFSAGGGLRIDHVMGLARLFWIPPGGRPSDGTYVRFAGHEMLEVLALESARAGALVVGEDLGTVERGFREELRSRRILSTRLVWFEDDGPGSYPRESLAMVTTHDLPTVAGVWTGADDEELVELGRPTPADQQGVIRRRLDAAVGLPADAATGAVIDAVHRRLGETPAVLTLATLEDVCEVPVRPNVPGTVAERLNWSRSLPRTVEQLVADPVAQAHLEALRDGRD
jgi:4-alpha-glucanotransferase